jgi:hypothetical protein
MADVPAFGERDEALARALADLGRHVAFPATPDLATAVARRIVEHPRPRLSWLEAARAATRLPLRRSLVLALIALLLLVGAAIGLGLGFGGLRIVPVPSLPPTSSPTSGSGGLGSELGLGQPSTLEAARLAVPFAVRVPTDPALGSPEAVYVGQPPASGRVELVYRAKAALPPAGPGGEGLLVTQFEGRTEQILMEKMIGPGTTLEIVTVAGGRGFWISGEPHVLLYRQPGHSDVDQERARLVGNALIWQEGDVIYRIESALGKEDAIRIAGSMR